MLLLQARVDTGTPARKGYSAFRLFSVISRTRVAGSYPFAEKQSVYSTAPTSRLGKHNGMMEECL